MSTGLAKTSTPSKELARERPQVPKVIPKLDTKSLEIAVSAKSDASIHENNGGLDMTTGSSDFDFDRTDWIDGRASPSKLKNGRLVATPERRLERRFWPRDTRGLLEICEQGYQLQQGMKTHCQDTTTALEQLVVGCESTVNSMLTNLEETCKVIQKEAERPANVDWSPIYTEFTDKISPAIVQSVLESQEATISQFQDQVAAQITKIVEQLHSSIGTLDEVQKAELVGLRQEMREVQKGTAAFEESTIRREEQMLTALREQQQTLSDFVASTLREVRDGVEDSRKHLSDIEPLLENQLNKQLEEAKAHDAQHWGCLKEIHRVVHADFGHLFHEIGTIQRAMNLPFVHMHREHRASTREGHSHKSREYWTQTDPKEASDGFTQTDPNITMPPETSRKKKDGAKKSRIAASQAAVAVMKDKPMATGNMLLADEESKKRKMREQLIKPQYNVANFYRETGYAQRIAKSQNFEHLTFLVIFLNAIWIAVDTDNNDASLIYDAKPIYQIAENLFCTYFAAELFIRFLAFRKKKYCLKDFWFVFDSILLVGMIVETWLVAIVFLTFGVGLGGSGGVSDLSLLRLIRLVKIFRMARMARLLRSVPELVMIMKGMGVAFRSVSFFALLAVVVLYIFAVAFRQITKDTDTGEKYFPTVPRSMGYLLMDGILPIYAPIVYNVSEGRPYLWPLILVFILLSSVTILNMLVGVLTEVVRTVAATEKDRMTVTHVTHQLREVLGDFQRSYDDDGPPRNGGSTQRASGGGLTRRMTRVLGKEEVDESLATLSKRDFEAFLSKPDVMKIIQDVGVDVVGLLDNADVIYEDKDKEGTGLAFVDFIDVVLNLRGSNPATVKDVKEMQRILKGDLHNVRDRLRNQIGKDIQALRAEMLEHLVYLEHKDSDSDDGEGTGTHSTMPRRPFQFRFSSTPLDLPFDFRDSEDPDDHNDSFHRSFTTDTSLGRTKSNLMS